MAAAANERLQDAAVGHQVDLQQYSNGVVRRIIATLNRVDADLAAALQAVLDRDGSSLTVERIEGLLQSVRALNASAYAAIGVEIASDLRELAAHEAGYQLRLFQSVVPAQVQVSVGIAAVNVEQVYAAAMSLPFQGRLLREWSASIASDRMARIRDAVRMGFVEQQPVADIVRRIRGTRAKGYSDGIIEIDRRHAEAVVRTAISHTAGFVRDRFFAGNTDLVKALSWTSTLDARTSPICQLRDGKQYMPVAPHRPVGHKIPWLGGPGAAHWQCRSTSVPVLKSWRELGIALDDVPPTERSSMDGQVPADLTYGAWLLKQSAARQDQVLGATRGMLFRRGGLSIERFANDRGMWLSLAELRARDAAAFAAAGL